MQNLIQQESKVFMEDIKTGLIDLDDLDHLVMVKLILKQFSQS